MAANDRDPAAELAAIATQISLLLTAGFSMAEIKHLVDKQVLETCKA